MLRFFDLLKFGISLLRDSVARIEMQHRHLESQPDMASHPKHIRALNDELALEIEWDDNRKFLLPFRFLRGRCPCAECVDENTGVRVLDLETIPVDIRPMKMEFSGNYALKITWSDNHNTGLYTWQHLSDIC